MESSAARKEGNPREIIASLEKSISLLREEKIKMREILEKKDAMILDLKDEMASLRREIHEYFSNNSPHGRNRSSGSDSEGMQAKFSEEEEEAAETEVTTMETEGNGLEENEEEEELLQPTKKKRKRRSRKKNKIQSSSSEEELVPTKKASTNYEEATQETLAGKSNLITRQTADNDDEFPPLPTSSNTLPAPVIPVAEDKILPRPAKVKAIPPIVVTNAGKFISIANLFKINNIRYTSAVVVRNGIKVFPSSVDDYRNATRLLEENKEPFYTFRFQEEKPNHVVLRGVPSHLTTEEIMADLKRQGFNPRKVIRWSHTNGKPMPLVLVLLPKAEKHIFQVRIVCTFEVRVEAQKSKTRGIQCYNCQDRGHAAPCCHVPAKCVKCGGDHHTSKCTKPREEPAKCANCAGDHPASYSGCLHHPAQFAAKKQSTFKGWGNQDNSRLAANAQTQASKPALGETLLSKAQLEQISQLFAEQLRTIMTQLTNRQ